MMHPAIRVGMLLGAALAFGFMWLMLSQWTLRQAHARDLGQWENTDPKVKLWYQTLKQPDSGISCCGEGDAYWADEQTVEDDGRGGKTVIAMITDDRDDVPLGRIHETIGTRYVIPPNKITRVDGNPTGHVVLFLSYPTYGGDGNQIRKRNVLCFVLNGGV